MTADPRLTEADRLMRQADGFDARADDIRDEAMELRQTARRIRTRVNRESVPRTPRVHEGVNYGVQARNVVGFHPEPHTLSATAATIAIPPCIGVGGVLDSMLGKEKVGDWPGCFPPCGPQEGCPGCDEARRLCDEPTGTQTGRVACSDPNLAGPVMDTAESVQADAERPKARRMVAEPIRRANLTPLHARLQETNRTTIRVRMLYAPRPATRHTRPAAILELGLN